MERREFLVSAAAGVAAAAGFQRLGLAQGRGPIDWSADPGKPGSFPAAKLARISIMTLQTMRQTILRFFACFIRLLIRLLSTNEIVTVGQ